MSELEKHQFVCPMTPLGNRLIVETDEYCYTGRVVIPDQAKRRPSTGVIVAISESAETASGLHLNDHVVFGQFSGTLVQFRGKPAYTILGADEVLAKLPIEGVDLDYTAAG